MKRLLLGLGCLLALSGCATAPPAIKSVEAPPRVVTPPRIAIALGGGAARGFAHVGVIKTLESHGISPQLVAGTSAGSVVGVLYAAGYNGFELQKIAFQLDESSVGDWTLPDRGFIKGELLQNFINRALHNKPIERLGKSFAAVATDLGNGEMAVFQRGNAGAAVRASSSVPGVFQPLSINGREYVDGGLTSPIPVKVARSLGADVVIAVDISSRPKYARVSDSVDVLLQTFSIMGQTIGQYELAGADVVIRPNTGAMGSTDFEQKHQAIMEGEKAALAALPLIRSAIQRAAARQAGDARH